MKRITLLLFLIFAGALCAQSGGQSIELPDFVITGVRSVDVPTASKRKPEIIPVVSKDFFVPRYTPDEIPFQPFKVAQKFEIEKPQSGETINGLLKLGAGRYTLPAGEFYLNQSFSNYLFDAKVWGFNTKDYLPNAGFNESGFDLKNHIFISTQSAFLPGMKININAKYYRDSYKLFASAAPGSERKTSRASGEVSFANSYGQYIDYSASAAAGYFTMNDNSVKELNVNLATEWRLKLRGFNLLLSGAYRNQTLEAATFTKNNYAFYNGRGGIRISLSDNLLLDAGLSYFGRQGDSFIAPFGKIAYKMQNGLTLFGMFMPYGEFLTVDDFVSRNIYFDLGTTYNVFTKYKGRLEAGARYQYDKYFEIGLTGSYRHADNFIYYDDVLSPGRFGIYTASGVDAAAVKLDMLFHPGPYGYFYGQAEIQSVKDNVGNFIPYNPLFIADLTYGFEILKDVKIEARAAMGLKSYSDPANTNEIPMLFNAGVKLKYALLAKLMLTADFQNIFNRANFVWSGYQAKPFDVILGAEYNW